MGSKWRPGWGVERREMGQLNQERSCNSMAPAEVSEEGLTGRDGHEGLSGEVILGEGVA